LNTGYNVKVGLTGENITLAKEKVLFSPKVYLSKRKKVLASKSKIISE